MDLSLLQRGIDKKNLEPTPCTFPGCYHPTALQQGQESSSQLSVLKSQIEAHFHNIQRFKNHPDGLNYRVFSPCQWSATILSWMKLDFLQTDLVFGSINLTQAPAHPPRNLKAQLVRWNWGTRSRNWQPVYLWAPTLTASHLPSPLLSSVSSLSLY